MEALTLDPICGRSRSTNDRTNSRRQETLSDSVRARRLAGSLRAPTAGRIAGTRFVEREPVHFQILDAPGERLGRLPQEVARRAAQDQKARPERATIGQHPEGREQLRSSLDFVENHQADGLGERQHGVVQSGDVARVLEIEERDPWALARDGPGQRALPALAGAEQGHHRAAAQAGAYFRDAAEAGQASHVLVFSSVSDENARTLWSPSPHDGWAGPRWSGAIGSIAP